MNLLTARRYGGHVNIKDISPTLAQQALIKNQDASRAGADLIFVGDACAKHR
jgi:hypothetical protein